MNLSGRPDARQTLKDRALTLALQIAVARAARRGQAAPVLDATPGLLLRDVAFAETLDATALPRLVEAAGQGILLVKTHAKPSDEWVAAYRRFAAQGLVRAHVIHRDPREVCLSLLDAARNSRERDTWEFTEYATLSHAVGGVLWHLREARHWAALPEVLHLDYDTCAFRMDEAIAAIKRDLGISCSTRLVQHYATRLAFTERNKAVKARHATDLDPQQWARLTEAFRPYLRERGYPTEWMGAA